MVVLADREFKLDDDSDVGGEGVVASVHCLGSWPSPVRPDGGSIVNYGEGGSW